MNRRHKIAIARIFDDLIKADRIVDTGEMECWQSICSKYDIDRDIRIEAREISFAEAIDTISNSGVKGLKEDLLGDCRAMTVSDGFCAHSEALLMITLIALFDSSLALDARVFSIPRANFNVDIATALYIEKGFDKETNTAICNNYRAIYKEFQLAGFHFIYIPQIIGHYRHTDTALFKSILSFLGPSLSEAGIDNAQKALMNMTTDIFVKDLLCNKCGITELRDTPPSLLIKIGTSFVGDTPYANYLRIEVDDRIIETVRLIADRFTSMLSSDIMVVTTSEERDNQFHFHGFYKQLLDIFLVRRNIRSRVVINPLKEEIWFPDIDTPLKKIHRREKALYALLLCMGDDGLNFTSPRGANEFERFNRRMQRIRRRYSDIYRMFGGDPEATPDLSIREIRGPIISCLKQGLKNLVGLYNPADYGVTKNPDGAFCVHLEPELVYVVQAENPEPVPLLESEMYSRIHKLE